LQWKLRDNGQTRIPVHIFPPACTTNGLRLLANVFDKHPTWCASGRDLKGGYDYFDQTHKLPRLSK
jgi:hypothetical protein